MSVKSDQKFDGLVTTVYRNRDGNLSILVINNSKNAVSVDFMLENTNSKQSFYLYQITERLVKAPDFKLNPTYTYKNSGKLNGIQLLPESITVLTTNGLSNEDFGVIE